MGSYIDLKLAAFTARPAISRLLIKTSTGPFLKVEKGRSITRLKFEIIFIDE
jgi:hypothetical protein